MPHPFHEKTMLTKSYKNVKCFFYFTHTFWLRESDNNWNASSTSHIHLDLNRVITIEAHEHKQNWNHTFDNAWSKWNKSKWITFPCKEAQKTSPHWIWEIQTFKIIRKQFVLPSTFFKLEIFLICINVTNLPPTIAT